MIVTLLLIAGSGRRLLSGAEQSAVVLLTVRSEGCGDLTNVCLRLDHISARAYYVFRVLFWCSGGSVPGAYTRFGRLSLFIARASRIRHVVNDADAGGI